MKKYVNDYKMLLVEARENELTLHNMNNKDLFHLLDIMLDRSISRNETKGIIKMLKKYDASNDSIIKELASELQISINIAEEFLNKFNKVFYRKSDYVYCVLKNKQYKR